MKLLKFLLVVGLAFIVATCAEAQEPFYKGKTVRLVVGFSAGGGFDVYSRAISRHLGKHLPGNPTVIVENMTGAGSLVAANHIFQSRQARWSDDRQYQRRDLRPAASWLAGNRIRRAQV